MEDLEINPLYKAFLTKFRREFDIACRMSYVIAVPHSDTLQECHIDQCFASAHILMPSKLLKSHFNPLQVGRNFDHIELDGKRLICKLHAGKRHGRPLVTQILAQEISYNAHNKEFRTILIDRPLVVDQLESPSAQQQKQQQYQPVLLRAVLGPFGSSSSSKSARRELEMSPLNSAGRANRTKKNNKSWPLKSHDDCFRHLESLSPSLTLELESEIIKLQATYLILADYLTDASERLKQLAESYVLKFELASRAEPNPTAAERHRLVLAVESYIVYLMHGKLVVAVQEHCERQDKLLIDKLAQLARSRLSLCQLGAQQYFADFRPSSELLNQLHRLSALQSPISIVSGLLELIELVSADLNQSVEFRRLLGSGDFDRINNQANSLRDHYSQQAVSICCDDLIATLVYSLAQARPANFYSLVKYLELFGWSSTSRDQAAYFAATVQIVVQYVMNYSSPSELLHAADHCERRHRDQDQQQLAPSKTTPERPISLSDGDDESSESNGEKMASSQMDNNKQTL